MPPPTPPPTDAWHTIDQLIESAAALARQATAPEDFYRELLRQASEVLDAQGSAAWLPIGHEQWTCCARLADGPDTANAPSADVKQWLESSPHAPRAVRHETAADRQALYGPVVIENEVAAVLEFRDLPAGPKTFEENQLAILAAFCEVAADYHSRRRARGARQRDEFWQMFDRFLEVIHRHLDLDATSYALANEGRRLLRWDRVSVLLRRGRCYRVRAISGLDSFDRRSGEVLQLQNLALAVSRMGEELWWAGNRVLAGRPSDGGQPPSAADPDLPPQVEQPLSQYVDHTTSRTVVVLAAAAGAVDALPDAMLVFERFDEHVPDAEERNLIRSIARHGGWALRNALRFERVPATFRGVGQLAGLLLARRGFPAAGVMTLLFAAAAALSLAKTDLEVYCRGELQPAVRHEIFAPADGSVEELHVQSAQRVSRGEVLLELHNPDLQFEWTRVLGELRTVRTQLDAVQASMSSAVRGSAGERYEVHQLAAEEQYLQAQLENLEAQQRVLEKRRAELRVVSPVDGELLTFNVREQLLARPVRRGQRLLTVARSDGRWQAELSISDHDLGQILAARQRQGDRSSGLPVRLLLPSDPTRPRHAVLTDVGVATELNQNGEASVTGIARILDSEQRIAEEQGSSQFRAGAAVAARVDCGRHAVGYVWFRDLIEVIRLKMWW